MNTVEIFEFIKKHEIEKNVLRQKDIVFLKKQELLSMPRGCTRPGQRQHPLGRILCNYTNKNKDYYDPIFDKAIREKQPQWFVTQADRANGNKRKLLELPKGCCRPSSRINLLGVGLLNYTTKKNSCYDPEFDKAIRKKQPQWFIMQSDKVRDNKRQLLELPRGHSRPIINKQPLGTSLWNYTKRNRESYDPEFDRAIRKKQPQWFVTQSDRAAEKKRQLLALPRTSVRPKIGDVLGNALCTYTCKYAACYDHQFDKTIRKKHPSWFVNSSDKKKSMLLKMSKNCERPNKNNGGALGTALIGYTCKKSKVYDPKFDAIIRARQPQWFVSKSSKLLAIKRMVLSIRKGKEKPTEFLKIIRYTRKAEKNYDPEFDRAIRKKQPQWFVTQSDKAAKKKRILLAMPKGCSRPNQKKHPLGASLGNYTCKNSGTYDLEFDKEIRRKQPQWFV